MSSADPDIGTAAEVTFVSGSRPSDDAEIPAADRDGDGQVARERAPD